MNLIVLCGLPGVGKLTVAKRLSAITGYGNFHNHLVVDALTSVFPFGSESFRQLREELWLAIMTRAAREGIAGLIFTFAFDGSVSPGFLVRLANEVATNGGRAQCVELCCERPELSSRLTSPDRNAYGKVGLADFLRLDSGGAFPRPELPPGVLQIDTTQLSPEQVVEKILSSVRPLFRPFH